VIFRLVIWPEIARGCPPKRTLLPPSKFTIISAILLNVEHHNHVVQSWVQRQAQQAGDGDQFANVYRSSSQSTRRSTRPQNQDIVADGACVDVQSAHPQRNNHKWCCTHRDSTRLFRFLLQLERRQRHERWQHPLARNRHRCILRRQLAYRNRTRTKPFELLLQACSRHSSALTERPRFTNIAAAPLQRDNSTDTAACTFPFKANTRRYPPQAIRTTDALPSSISRR
jgi:hypothetical protein